MVANSPGDCGSHLLILPGPQAGRANEHDASGRLLECRLESRLPGGAGDQMPLIEKGANARPFESPGDFLDDLLVCRVMG
jgi:hypothetical protein